MHMIGHNDPRNKAKRTATLRPRQLLHESILDRVVVKQRKPLIAREREKSSLAGNLKSLKALATCLLRHLVTSVVLTPTVHASPGRVEAWHPGTRISLGW